jgi:hypothetical protein
MPLTTPQAICSLALRAAGVLGVGQTALAQDMTDTFDVLNGMMGQWNTDRWLIYQELDVSVVTTGQMSYTIGPGATDIVTNERVDRLESAYFRQFVDTIPGQNYVDFPLRIINSHEDYAQITLKELTSWPYGVFLDSGNPIGTIYPYPIPLQNSTYELHLIIKQRLAQFVSLVQSINLPLEYIEPLWTNLALRLGAIYPGVVLPPIVEALAKATLSKIRTANTQIPAMRMPQTLVRPPLYNIYSGQTY